MCLLVPLDVASGCHCLLASTGLQVASCLRRRFFLDMGGGPPLHRDAKQDRARVRAERRKRGRAKERNRENWRLRCWEGPPES